MPDENILPLKPYCGGVGEAAILHGYMEAKGGLWIVEPWAMGSVNLLLGGENPDLLGTRKIDAVQFDTSGPCRIHNAHAEDKRKKVVTTRLQEIQRLWRSANTITIVEAKSALKLNAGWAVIGQSITSEYAMRFSYGETDASLRSVIVVGDANRAMQRQAEEIGLSVEFGTRCRCASR